MTTQILQPEVTLALANADLTVQNTPQRVLAVGQMVAAGTAVTAVLIENVASGDEDGLFGANSMIAGIVRAFKRVNPVVQIDVIPLDDAVGTPRVVGFAIGGPATEAGTISVIIASERDHRFDIAVADADSATDIADAITLAANADGDLPATVSNVAGAVTVTFDNDGTVANDLGVEVILGPALGGPAGVTLAVAVTETTPGATDPTLTGVLDVATARYQGIIWPYAAQTVLAAYLLPRFNPTNAILDGVGITSIQDSHANSLTTLNALNDQNLVIFADETQSAADYLGPAQLEASYVKSAYFAGIRALRLVPDQPISQFLTSSASLDQRGGPALASMPYFNTPVSFLPVPRRGRGWTQLEIEQLLTAGGSVMGQNSAGTGALVGEVATTYKTDPAANLDPTWKFLNYLDTSSNIREYMFNNLKTRFAQSRLTTGSVTRGRDQANGPVIRAYVEKLYQDLGGVDFVLVQSGETALTFFKNNLTITLDLALGKVTIQMLVPIVTQLRVIVATIKIAFSTEG